MSDGARIDTRKRSGLAHHYYAQPSNALARLSLLRQNLLRHAFFEGLTHEEIGFEADLPLGTVKSHLRRTLMSLRDSIDDPGTALRLLSHK